MGQMWSCLPRLPNTHIEASAATVEQHIHRFADQSRSVDTSLLECLATAHWLTIPQLHFLFVDHHPAGQASSASTTDPVTVSSSPTTSHCAHVTSTVDPLSSPAAQRVSDYSSQVSMVCLPTTDHPRCCKADAASAHPVAPLAERAHPLLLDIVDRTRMIVVDAAVECQLRPARDRSQMFHQSTKGTLQQVRDQHTLLLMLVGKICAIGAHSKWFMHLLVAVVAAGKHHFGPGCSRTRSGVRSGRAQAAIKVRHSRTSSLTTSRGQPLRPLLFCISQV